MSFGGAWGCCGGGEIQGMHQLAIAFGGIVLAIVLGSIFLDWLFRKLG